MLLKSCLSPLLICVACGLSAQTAVITDISIEGNKRTKERTILREVSFALGDTIPDEALMMVLKKSENQVYNLGLFNKVTISIKDRRGPQTHILITVDERWYTWPVPVFELVDRNFNVWWQEHNADLGRAVYGLRFYQENVRGRNEQLKLVAQFGYTQKFEIFYDIPFIDKKQHYGLEIGSSFSTSKQIAYRTFNNKQDFYTGKDNVRERFYSSIKFSKRKKIHVSQYLEIKYQIKHVADSIGLLNKNYYGNSATTAEYIYMRYEWINDHRDIKAYPLEGSYSILKVSKTGLGLFNDLDMIEVEAQHARYYTLSKNVFLAAKLHIYASGPKQQPYALQYGLGYGQNFVRGFELYLIDAQYTGLFKSSLRYRILNTEVKNIPMMPLKQFRTIPIAVYIKLYSDFGYGRESFEGKVSPLNETYLAGWGPGIDVVTYYDLVFRLEYSFNNLAENGIYLHFKLDI